MLSISGKTNTYKLDLNDFPYESNVLDVISEVNSFPLTFGVKYVTNPNVNANVIGGNKLDVTLDLKSFKEPCWICLANTDNEELFIEVIPNHEMSREKFYSFKLGKISIENGVVTINVISKESGKNHPWYIGVEGTPLSYEVTKTKTKITAKLTSMLASDYKGRFVLVQEESNNEIEFFLSHSIDGAISFGKENEQSS